jgi:hypothetical protein
MIELNGSKSLKTLPAFDLQTNINYSPHVVILGAGASKAALPRGDANGKPVPIMAELIECLNLRPLLQSYGIHAEGVNFEALYDDLVSSHEHTELVREIESRVHNYFISLKLPDTATLYDYIVLGLREKDMIATFNWDPFLSQAWQRNSQVVKLPRIIFLHGNVKIGICANHMVKDFMGNKCNKCGEFLKPTPLLYPVKHKDYNNDPFIASEWKEFSSCLNHAYFLTVFGYAVPTTDVEARELMQNTWQENRTFELAQVEIFDIKLRRDLEKTWANFFCRTHYGIGKDIWQSYLFSHPRRSCEAFAMATLQNSPWQDNPFPRMRNLAKLQRWVRLLWTEECGGELSGRTCAELEGAATK